MISLFIKKKDCKNQMLIASNESWNLIKNILLFKIKISSFLKKKTTKYLLGNQWILGLLLAVK